MLDQTSRVGCECVIAGGEWEPCRAHDLELAVMTSGPVSTDDMFVRSRLQWHVTDSRMVATMPGTTEVKSSRTVALKVPVVTWDAAWHASHVCNEYVPVAPNGWAWRTCRDLSQVETFTPGVFAEYVTRARAVRDAAHAKARRDVGNLGRPTTAKARKAVGGRRRTASEIATELVSEPVAVDLDRLARLTRAMAVVGDTWADRS